MSRAERECSRTMFEAWEKLGQDVRQLGRDIVKEAPFRYVWALVEWLAKRFP